MKNLEMKNMKNCFKNTIKKFKSNFFNYFNKINSLKSIS